MVNNKLIRILTNTVFCSALLCSAPLHAENLVQLYKAALDGDPQLRSAQFDHQASQEVVTQAWSGYRPEVNFTYDQTTTEENIIKSLDGANDGQSLSYDVTSWALTITQPIFRYANYLRIGQAKTELRQADAELINAQQDLMLRVSEAYMEALASQDELDFLNAELSAARQHLKQAKGRESAAVGRKVDRYDAEARVASVEADYAEADVSLRDAYEALYEMTGADAAGLAELQAEIDLVLPVPADEQYWLDNAMKNNPSLVTQREAVDVARQEVKRQNAGHYPTLDAVFSNSTRATTDGGVIGGENEFEKQELMLKFNLPIYSGGSVSSNKRQAVARYHSAEQELTRILRESRRQSRATYRGVVNAVKRVKALKTAVEAQQATLDLRRAAYDARLETAISVLDAERDLYASKRDLSRAKYDYLINGLRLKALVGVLTQDDLVLVNNWLEG